MYIIRHLVLTTAALLTLTSSVFAATGYFATYGSGTISTFDTENPTVATDFITGLANPIGVGVDLDSNVYVSLAGGDGTIQKYDSAGTFVSQVDNLGFLPYSVRFDLNNVLYVADLNGQVIRRYTDQLAPLTNFATTNGLPTGIRFDSAGHVFVTNAGYGSNVQSFDLDGNLLGQIGDSSSLSEPHDVITDAAGNMYVSSRGNQVVVKYDADGNLVDGAYISGYDPYGLLIDGNKLFVADLNEAKINVYDLADNGAYVSSIETGALPTYIATNPTAFAVPEPSSILLLVCGCSVFWFMRRKKMMTS